MYFNDCLTTVATLCTYRVCPDTSLHSLRKEITEQLDIKLLPDSYVFLRNVGRHLTWVCDQALDYPHPSMSSILC